MNIKEVSEYLSKDIKENLYSKDYQNIISKASTLNTWFLPQFICSAFHNLTYLLDTIKDETLLTSYTYNSPKKNILIIAAGNIPMVCFHDIMCVLLTGNHATVKLSSKDTVLIPFVFERLEKKYPEIKNYIDFIQSPTKTTIYDGVIATGSNSTRLVFEQYFSSLKHIIRGTMHSVAVIKEGDDLSGLEDDICLYFGFGCRNVSHLFVPKGYRFNALKSKLEKYNYLLDANKYRNNFDYQKAIMTMNNIPFSILSPILLRENDDLYAPISVLYYSYYEDINDLNAYLCKYKDELQIILDDSTFGTAQKPKFTSYADNLNTVSWLLDI